MLKNKGWLCLLLGVCLLLTACGGKTSDDNLITEDLMVPEDINYTTVSVTKGDFINSKTGIAEVEYPIAINLTWQTPNSRLKELKVSVNDEVKKGEVLAVFETKTSQAEKADLELQIKRRKEAMEQEKTSLLAKITAAEEKVAGLTSHEKNIAVQELEILILSYEQYLSQTQEAISVLEEKLAEILALTKENTLVAPFDCVIKNLEVNEGSIVTAGQAILSVYSDDLYYIKVTDAPEKFRYGMEVSVTAGKTNQEKTFTGTVVTAPNVLPADLQLGKVLICMDETVDDSEFLHTIRYEIFTEHLSDVILIDRKALYREGNKTYVRILEDGAVKKRYVTEGLSNNEISWIADGLQEGQTLVVE